MTEQASKVDSRVADPRINTIDFKVLCYRGPVFKKNYLYFSRWSWSGPSWPLNPPATEQSSTHSGVWLWAGAWSSSFSSGSLLSPYISWRELREASGRFVLLGKDFFFFFWSAILMLLFFLQRVKALCSPSKEWHPYLDIHRGERYSVERCRQRIADINWM